MRFAFGFALHQAGQDKSAIEALEVVVQKYPESGWAAAARQQIEHIRNPQPDHQH
jgi:outer membrane protein assembly factor BamD (BamD/ComL family)